MKRYTIINEYYIQDNQTGEKYNQQRTCHELNIQEHKNQKKNLLIEQLLNILYYKEDKK